MAPGLLVERRDRITVLTLNRPEKHNAFDDETRAAISTTMLAFDADPDQYVAIITGAGERAFCSGSDLSTPTGGRTETGRRAFLITDMFGIGAVSKPVIAAVNGLAVGGGCEMALACDIRIAAESAWFGLFEPKHGIIPGAAAHLLPRMLSYGDAAWMLLTAERVGAAEGCRTGLVQRVVPLEQLLPEALRIAEGMCALSQVALQGVKKVLRHERDLFLKESLALTDAVIQLLEVGGDAEEGRRAFRERREPRFTNRWPHNQPE